MIKERDYVKYQENIYPVEKCYESTTKVKGLDSAINNRVLTALTPEETLEHFKSRFEGLNYELTIHCLGKITFAYRSKYEKPQEIDESFINVTQGYMPNKLIDLIREFQQWYWRDK